jgi:hypothetical protein
VLAGLDIVSRWEGREGRDGERRGKLGMGAELLVSILQELSPSSMDEGRNHTYHIGGLKVSKDSIEELKMRQRSVEVLFVRNCMKMYY